MTTSVIAQVRGRGVPLRGNDIDTDRIIPARFLRCVTFDGLGAHAFEDDRAQLKARAGLHPFDEARFQGGRILVVGGNFGCGSSREHAPQAIARWGIAAIAGVSFSEIFFGNCVAMGLPCVHLSAADVEALQGAIERDPAAELTLDLAASEVRLGGTRYGARMPDGPRQQFLSGAWDALGELRGGLETARACAGKLPYLASFV
jgi:3-isopropylmalate/(R)-2-methylmalate dehydratase small subunit